MAFDIGAFYRIINKQSGKSLDIRSQSLDNDAIVVQNTWQGSNSQKFMVYPLNGDYYALSSKVSGKTFDVRNHSMDDLAIIVQNTWQGSQSQQFHPSQEETDYFSVQCRHSGKVWDVRNESMDNDAIIQQYTWKGINGQKFNFSPVESILVPSTPVYPPPPVPEYEDIDDILPTFSEKVVTNYTLAPFFAVNDPYYPNENQQIQTNPYYLYVKKQYWEKVASVKAIPGQEFNYTVTSGMTHEDQNIVSTTVGHTIGADLGFQFGKSEGRHSSASLSYQYTTQLGTVESTSDTTLEEKTEGYKYTNTGDFTVAWSMYILVSEYSLERSDGTLVNEPWIVKDEHTLSTSSYPPSLAVSTGIPVDMELEHAKQAVYDLFADAQHTRLKVDTTDYMIDQAARLVEQLSDEDYALEKMKLLNFVRCAKQRSKKRNLLHYGDFESPNWRNPEDGWQASYDVTVLSDSSTFKGNYLNMPGATTRGGNITPTYVYQKVDESKLKPYTRYLVRGFVGSSKELELFVTRYGKEVHSKMNLPASPRCTCNQTYSTQDGCSIVQTMAPTNGLCEDKPHFVFHIDVGEICPKADLGIGVGFKISSPEGMAQLDNIEVIEANPLTGEALARVKKREKKWKKEMEQKCALAEKAIGTATQAVDYLFTDAQKNRLKATTTMQDIQNAEAKVKAIPYVYNVYFEEVPGMDYTIFQALQSDVYKASNLYRIRNVIRNGDFSSGLSNWHATDGADVQERDGNPHVLVISQWDANVSQEVCVQPERGYVLRVTARKEGSGKGYVTISDCTADNTETVTFTSDETAPTPRPYVRPNRPIPSTACEVPCYGESFGIIPETNPMMNVPPADYRPGACSCGCNHNVQEHKQSYQAKPMQNTTVSPSGYMTKTIEIFPENNRIRIEIGETGGTFLVE
ncbi:RICIN domain-containing protein, partial [Bacillus toyonensis]|uniref:RICIN domain-containing protein n=1 Tax=Bacillus toyonensis TaxID=155322 RepID=UPI003D196CE0